MYAVIQTGGKQYRVEEGATIRVEKLEGDRGRTLEFDQVLLVADGENIKVGAPSVPGAKVTAEIASQGLGEKLVVFKFRRKKGYRRKRGHRQPYTALKITGITA
ncbi:MAG: 50S ribosomal protein L21 [Deltaproteobacteria bacterium]|nr:50S ribosomal protein L21 [Deltaproteobacteria bacterium]